MQRPFLILHLDLCYPHLLAGYYLDPAAAAETAGSKQVSQRRFRTTLLTKT